MTKSGVVYIENIFILNLIMNFYLLKLTAKVLNLKPCLKRLILGSIAGAVGYCLVISIPCFSYTLKVMAGMLPVGILMIKLGLNITGIKALLYGIGWMFTFSFILGGFILFLKGKLPVVYESVQGGIFIMACGLLGYELFQSAIAVHKSKAQNRFCTVRLDTDKGWLKIAALIDTGNGLTDPISHKPVAVLEEEIWRSMTKWMRKEKFRVIPYHSIGKEHGILEGYEVDRFEVECDTGMKTQNNVIVAVFKGKLSECGGYQMILPPELLI